MADKTTTMTNKENSRDICPLLDFIDIILSPKRFAKFIIGCKLFIIYLIFFNDGDS
ncbi:hypothetical protein Mefer_0599 [Methanocaldococcus fervens AG86]|uniref:Uncharacterized protein n=1 Tax=Methanocaldococcus fervens (strain DSM 4213 / JCM 15782 / AG86) TaxID=573064 RepID=C7P788_METFA|nr:hypothetical protein Mefer_0599 [Methanocaldococcus fervens AG86]